MKRISPAVIFGVVLLLFASPAFSFMGINYSPFHYPGQSPNVGTAIPDSQFITDLQTLSPKFKVIRSYGVDTTTRLNRIVPLAAQYAPDVKIWVGVWESNLYNGAANKTYLDTAISQANTYSNVSAIIVGNECLPGDPIGAGAVSVAQMITDLQYVKSKITNKSIKVTTCLTYGAGVDNRGQQVAPYCDVIMVNVYPFYGGVNIGNNQAINNLINAYKNIFIPKYPGKAIVIGETGWPSAPSNQPINNPPMQAVPSLANETTFINQVIANAANLGDTFLYAAFDEPWGPGGNAWGPYWGIWDQNRNAKFNLALTLNEALDNNSLSFATSGDANWFPETDIWDFGGSAARSGDIGDDQATLLQTTVTGPGTLSFWWKVSSEAGNDFLDLFVDSDNPARISGGIDWVQQTVAIPAGLHNITWQYGKNMDSAVGSDCGWVDMVVFTKPSSVSAVNLLLLD
jgi:exo-beta-1,3-glucanase (GH17 family)